MINSYHCCYRNISSNCFLFFSFLSICILWFSLFLYIYHVYVCILWFSLFLYKYMFFSFSTRNVFLTFCIHSLLWMILKLYILISALWIICLLCKFHIMCLVPYICISMYELHFMKVWFTSMKRHRAKSSKPFPSSTCITNCPNASTSHLPDSLAYLVSSH